MNTLLSHLPNPLKWLLLLPASLGAAWLAGALIHWGTTAIVGPAGGPLTYAAALLAGFAYVWVALSVAHALAPQHRTVVVIVLGVLILGDVCVAHVIVRTGLIEQPGAGDLAFLFRALRVGDYDGVPHGGLVKIAGCFIGACVAWLKLVRRDSRSGPPPTVA